MYRFILLTLTLIALGYYSLVYVVFAQTVSPTTDRLATAHQIYVSGNYELARQSFAAIVADPAATAKEQRQALHWRGRSERLAGDPLAAINTLTAFAQQYPTDALNRATQFNLGAAYQQANQPGAALKAYQASLRDDDPINVYIYEQLGDVSLQTRAFTETIAFYQAGVDSTTDLSLRTGLQRKMADVEMVRGNPAGAIAQYETILQNAKIDWFRARILKLMGEAYIAAGQPDKGYETYLEAVNSYPTAYDSYLALVELVNANVPVDEFQRGIVNYHAKSYLPAIAAFERYLNAPEPAQPADAIWHMGLSQQGAGQYANAIDSFQRLIDNYPNHIRWSQAHLEIGKMLGWLNRTAEATAVYRQFATENPTKSGAGQALWQAGRLEYDADMFAAAMSNLRDMATTYPANEYADDALYWAGRAAFKLADYQQAAEIWGDLVANYPEGDLYTFGGYWQAKALQMVGQSEQTAPILEAIKDEPLDYYALRAQDMLAGRQPHAIPLALPSSEQLTTEQADLESWLRSWASLTDTVDIASLSPALQQDPAFQRGQALLEIGLRDKALVEFETVKDNWWDSPAEMYQLALYFQEQYMGRLSILSAARLSVLSPAESIEETPLFLQRLFYPVYFPELLFTEAESQGIDPALALALMRQESLFEYSAESIAGARGLMQVMPATGEYIAQHTEFPNFETDHLWLPYVSIKFGTWYLRQQLGLFEGEQFPALAAYNAGPGNVLEWVKVSDDLDMFVEEIPFWESRLYIRTIYINLAAYRRLYGLPDESN